MENIGTLGKGRSFTVPQGFVWHIKSKGGSGIIFVARAVVRERRFRYRKNCPRIHLKG